MGFLRGLISHLHILLVIRWSDMASPRPTDVIAYVTRSKKKPISGGRQMMDRIECARSSEKTN